MEENPNSELLPKISEERRQLTPQELQWLHENGGNGEGIILWDTVNPYAIGESWGKGDALIEEFPRVTKSIGTHHHVGEKVVIQEDPNEQPKPMLTGTSLFAMIETPSRYKNWPTFLMRGAVLY